MSEFENGMHHTVQFDVWRAIFRLAAQLNVQIFATSHSWDAVETFQKAAAESLRKACSFACQEKAMPLFQHSLASKNSAVATRDHIEVR